MPNAGAPNGKKKGKAKLILIIAAIVVVLLIIGAAFVAGRVTSNSASDSSAVSSAQPKSTHKSTGDASSDSGTTDPDNSGTLSGDGDSENGGIAKVVESSYSKDYYWYTDEGKVDAYKISMTIKNNLDKPIEVRPKAKITYAVKDDFGDSQSRTIVMNGMSVTDEKGGVPDSNYFKIFGVTLGDTNGVVPLGANEERDVDFYLQYDPERIVKVSNISVEGVTGSKADADSYAQPSKDWKVSLEEKEPDGEGQEPYLQASVKNSSDAKWRNANVNVMYIVDGHPYFDNGSVQPCRMQDNLKPGQSGECRTTIPSYVVDYEKQGHKVEWKVTSVIYDRVVE
ncbi:hypothetical protein [Bifidobacterium colobi]|nr:hypothetical protein [Bifidobacterium colobi]